MDTDSGVLAGQAALVYRTEGWACRRPMGRAAFEGLPGGSLPAMGPEAPDLFTRLAPVLNLGDLAAERAFYESSGYRLALEGPNE